MLPRQFASMLPRPSVLVIVLASLLLIATVGCHSKRAHKPADTEETIVRPTPANELHVHPGEEIQVALDRVAKSSRLNTVVVHAGTYRPPEHRQSLIWFNRRHDGVQLKAQGEVILTAANPEIANSAHKAYPAVVNHVVFFGDGISGATKINGFTITGANSYITTKKGPPIEPDHDEPRLGKTAFFYTDGGAIKVFGRSYPTLENLNIIDNFASPSGAGISIEHRGYVDEEVTIRNCRFENNRSPLTGSALCLLDHEYGSRARIENCLFTNNLSNCDLDKRSQRLGTWRPQRGHGAVTLFAFSQADFSRCTFVGNRNGLDDLSQNSRYQDCVFWSNQAAGGWPEGKRYELLLSNPETHVTNCFLAGDSLQLAPEVNMLEAPNPEFDNEYCPQNSLYAEVGYRPPDVIARKPATTKASIPDETTIDSLQISVTGNEFNWYFRYPGKDNTLDTDDDVTVRRHCYVPTKTKVHLIVESRDFLYQFSLPEQKAKQVAIPGMTHRCSFSEDKPGVYPFVGDQFCGYTHPNLIGKLVVKTPSEFEKWLDQTAKEQTE